MYYVGITDFPTVLPITKKYNYAFQRKICLNRHLATKYTLTPDGPFTKINGCSYTLHSYQSYRKLYIYISSNNIVCDQNTKIAEILDYFFVLVKNNWYLKI